MNIPGMQQDCLSWYVHFEAETCDYHEEDAVDCTESTGLDVCSRTEAYDSCDDVGFCYVAWTEDGQSYNETCTVFWEWHAEWARCREVFDEFDCSVEAGVHDENCKRVEYVSPCVDFQTCWAEITDLSGTYHNITCQEYYGVIDGSYAPDYWCREVEARVPCEDLS
jgi:hypothetical protein